MLVVDDQPDVRRVISLLLSKEGYEIELFPSGEQCLSSLTRLLPDAVYLDLDMPGLGGLETLERIRAKSPNVPVIMLTADDNIDTVVKAMRLGAYDYIVKPPSRQKIATATRNAISYFRMTQQRTSLERKAGHGGYPNIVARSDALMNVFRQMDQVAASDVTLLIHGESGTGKELVAKAIHGRSARHSGPFIAINCAAIPETLQESELFGHEKGAFTGATERRKGKFELADGGTLFLDEVAELSLPLQAKLLRTLQEGTFQRVGGSHELRSDFRLVAATHRNLTEEVRAGGFRKDLYFRIVVFELELPPLRDRIVDVEPLVAHFLALHAEKHGSLVSISPEALDVLVSYAWPGNIRELQNAVQRAIVFTEDGVIGPEHLPPRVRGDDTMRLDAASAGPPGGTASSRMDAGSSEELNLVALERRAIKKAMRLSGGNVSEVGRLLGISRATLYRKLKKYELR